MRDGRVIGTHPLRSLGLQSDRMLRDFQQLGDASADCSSMWADFGLSKDQRGVHVRDGVAGSAYAVQSLLQKDDRIGAFPLKIRRREKRADVRGGDSAEQSVSGGVQEDVSVRVATQPFVVRQSHPADLERNAGFEFVRVPAVANSYAATPATDLHGFSRAFFLSLSKRSRRNWGR